MADVELSGRCLCGAVRYRILSPPFDAGWCHCRICQLSSGSPAMAFATVPAHDYDIAQGADRVRTVASSDFGWRRFCGDCGAPLTMQVDHQPDTIDFAIATLDRPDGVAPQFHIFYASRIAWAQACDGMDRHDRFRPETRGL